MLVVEVNVVGSESRQRAFNRLTNHVGAPIRDWCAVVTMLQVDTTLGGEDDGVAPVHECLTYQFLVKVRAVGLGGVEEGVALVDGRVKDPNTLGVIKGRAVGVRDAHAAVPESGDVEASQIDCSHDVPFYGTPGMVSETVLTPRSSPQLLRSHD